MQDVCGNCKAFLQPEWTKCKICGQEVAPPGSEPEVDDAPTSGRRSRKTKASRAKAGKETAGKNRASSEQAPRSTAPSPARTSKPARSDQSSGGPNLQIVLAVLLVLTLVAVAVFALSGGDDESTDPDRPAGESTEEEQEALLALGEWDLVQLESGGAVQLPGPALQQQATVQIIGVGRIEMSQAQVIDDGQTYIFAGGELSDSVSHLEPDQILLGAVEGVADSVGGTVEATKAITVDGDPALRARITVPGGRETRVAAVMAGGRIYVLQVNSAGEADLDPIYLQRMVDTFES